MGSEGTLQLPTASRGGLGRCTDKDGKHKKDVSLNYPPPLLFPRALLSSNAL